MEEGDKSKAKSCTAFKTAMQSSKSLPLEKNMVSKSPQAKDAHQIPHPCPASPIILATVQI